MCASHSQFGFEILEFEFSDDGRRMSAFPSSTTSYTQQLCDWPKSGRQILAQYDDDTIVVYQAYRPEIGHFAVEHGHFAGEFKYSRMSWIKPNFMWMMYHSDWGRSKGQEVILAIRLKKTFLRFVA
jgi:hypothetical protein